MENLIEKYMKSIADKSKNTKTSYLNDLLKFSRFYSNQDINLESFHFIKYIDYLFQHTKSSASINRSISVLKNFSIYLNKNFGLQIEVELFNQRKIKMEVSQYYVKSSIIYKLMDGISRWSRSAPMHASLFGIMYECGLKKSVLLNLKLKNVKIIENNFYIHLQSNGNILEYELSLNTSMHLRQYLNSMQAKRRHKTQEDYLFQKFSLNLYDEDNKPLNPKTINQILEKSCEYSQINIKLTPAQIRNSFLYFMKNSKRYRITDKALLAGYNSDIAFYTTVRRLEEISV